MDGLKREIEERDLGNSAIVFSPHPDDETLGCGGTILRKKRLGAEVKIFFMTDGRRSHLNLISGDELKLIRTKEALAAGRVLGLDEEDVGFLEFEDGQLNKSWDSAVEKVKEIILSHEFDEIFIPHEREPIAADHSATNRIVMSAVQECRKTLTIYEYPVWLFFNLPWVGLPANSLKGVGGALKQGLISGSSFLVDINCSVNIEDFLETKRAALDQHKSQMTRLISDPKWHTLGEIANGDFLECFFQKHEFFVQTHYKT